MLETITEILTGLRPDVDFSAEKQLVDDGVLTSFDMVMLVGELNDAFDVNISIDDILPENFNSPELIALLVSQLQSRV